MRSLISNAVAAFASVALTTGIVAFADPANADIGTPTRVIVRTDDLNLRPDDGLATAVERACGDDIRDVAGAQCRARETDAATYALDRIAAL